MPRRQDEFERVALPHAARLLRFARRLAGNANAAEDLVQDALLQAWRGFDQFRADTNVRAWLYRILINAHYANGRKARSRIAPASMEHTAIMTSPNDTQEALEIREALDQLPEEQRAVTLLALMEGFTCREIAEILSVPMGTVMSRLSRARQALRDKLRVEQETR